MASLMRVFRSSTE